MVLECILILGQMNIKVERKYGINDRLLDNIIIHLKTNDKKNFIARGITK